METLGNTTKDNYSISSLVRMCWLPPCR